MGKKKSTALVIYDGNKLVANEDLIKQRQQTMRDEIEQAKKAMNPDLLGEAEELRKAIDTMFTRGFARAWHVGNRLKMIENEVDKFGAGAVPKLAAYLHYSKEALYTWMHFASDYTEEQVKELSEMRMKISGSPLSWKHITEAYFVEDKKLRLQFLNLATKHDLTPSEMADAIRQKFGTAGGKSTQRHAGGRPRKVPATYSARLEMFEKYCDNLIATAKEVWQHDDHGFLCTLDDVPSDKLGGVVKSMDRVLDKTDTAMDRLSGISKELTKARALANDRIEEQDKSAKAAGSKKTAKAAKAEEEEEPAHKKTLSEVLSSTGDD